jgi:hypothetical protein
MGLIRRMFYVNFWRVCWCRWRRIGEVWSGVEWTWGRSFISRRVSFIERGWRRGRVNGSYFFLAERVIRLFLAGVGEAGAGAGFSLGEMKYYENEKITLQHRRGIHRNTPMTLATHVFIFLRQRNNSVLSVSFVELNTRATAILLSRRPRH